MDEQQEIIQSIIDVNNIAIVMHDNPDSDAIGSAIALENALKQMNKQVTIITQNKIKKKYLDVFGKNRVNKINIPNDFFDILFVLDCSEECRINLDIRDYSNKIIVIDHHNGFEPYGDIYWCEDVIANSMLIYKLIKMMMDVGLNVLLNSKIATALYMGIRSDSFNFRNPNVTPETHEICSELLKYSADTEYINELERYSRGILKLEIFAFNSLLYDEHYKIIYTIITKDMIDNTHSTFEDASQIIDALKLIKNVDVALLFISAKGKIYIKARSTKYNVSKVMKQFGGGGHKLAAGAVCFSDSSYSLMNSVVKAMRLEIENKKVGKKK